LQGCRHSPVELIQEVSVSRIVCPDGSSFGSSSFLDQLFGSLRR